MDRGSYMWSDWYLYFISPLSPLQGDVKIATQLKFKIFFIWAKFVQQRGAVEQQNPIANPGSATGGVVRGVVSKC